MSELPWNERVVMLSLNPDAASLQDVAKLSAELMEARELLGRALVAVEEHGYRMFCERGFVDRENQALSFEIRAFLEEEKKP